MLILEITLHTTTFIYLVVMSIFSKRHREKMKENWHASSMNRLYIISGIVVYSTILALALFIWIPHTSSENTTKLDNKTRSPATVEFSTYVK